MPQRLTRLKVNEVSLVNDGANQLADIALTKRNDRTFKIGKALSEDQSLTELVEGVGAAVRSKYGPADQMSWEHHICIEDVFDGAVIFEQDEQYWRAAYSVETAGDGTKTYTIADRVPVKVVYEDMTQKGNGMADTNKQPEPTNKAADPVDIAKLVAAEVEKARAADKAEFQKQLDDSNAVAKAAQERAEKAEQAAQVEKNARETLEFTKRAQSEIPNLPGEDVEKGTILRTLANQLRAEDFEKVMTLLKAGNTAMAKGFVPVGASGNGDSDPVAKLETLAKARATEKHISVAKAKDQILTEQPELYKEIRDAERRVN